VRLGVLRCSNILAGGGSYDIHTYEKYSTSREIMYVYGIIMPQVLRASYIHRTFFVFRSFAPFIPYVVVGSETSKTAIFYSMLYALLYSTIRAPSLALRRERGVNILNDKQRGRRLLRDSR
jgi:hypothetical protein